MLGLSRQVGAAAPEIWKLHVALEQGSILLQAHHAGTRPSPLASCAEAAISLEQ